MTDTFSIGDRVRIKQGVELSRDDNKRRQASQARGTVKPRNHGDAVNCERIQWDGEVSSQTMYAAKLELVPGHNLSIGDKVTHDNNPQYGVGTVSKINGTDEYSAVSVEWQHGGYMTNTARYLTPVEPKVEQGLDPSSVRAKTLASLKADRLVKLRNIGTNQTTVDELNDKIERDTALVQELDDLIRDIEKPTKEEHALKIGDKVRHASTNQKATILNFEGSEQEIVVVQSGHNVFRWWIKNTFKA